jgi:hypothetical protein
MLYNRVYLSKGLNLSLMLLPFSFASVLSVYVSLLYFDNGTTNILYNFKYALLDIMLSKGLNVIPMKFITLFTNFL